MYTGAKPHVEVDSRNPFHNTKQTVLVDGLPGYWGGGHCVEEIGTAC